VVDAEEAVFFPSPGAWRDWLLEHGESQDILWVGFWRRGTDRPTLTWDEAVDEALCHGWIDGLRRRVDDQRYRIRFTPRRPRSMWSAKNLKRVAELETAGRMRPRGTAAFEARPAEPAGYSSERSKPVTLPTAYREQLEASPSAAAFFDAQPPGYRRLSIHWVISAKREETRLRRLAALIEDSANGLKVKPLRPPAPPSGD
jgi:uncharacterized protein YdeI (YjbR/CyaY-like superfamily)